MVLKPASVGFDQASASSWSPPSRPCKDCATKENPSRQKVLINGASGGVGTLAVQIAKARGADVTAVCSGKNADMVRSIGADRVIDYTREDFTTGDEHYDLIFDLVGNHSFSERRRVLSPNGICVMAALGGAGWHDGFFSRLGGELTSYIGSRFVKQKFIAYIAEFNKADMMVLRDLLEAGKIKPVIDRKFPIHAGARSRSLS